MDLSTLRQLEQGDVVRADGELSAFLVHANYGTHAVAVRTFEISHDSDWVLPHGLAGLRPGDIAVHRNGTLTCVVTHVAIERATAVVTVDVNPDDSWRLIVKRTIVSTLETS